MHEKNPRYYSNEEIAEEFGVYRPLVDRETTTTINKQKSSNKGGEQDEKTKKLQSEPDNTSQ